MFFSAWGCCIPMGCHTDRGNAGKIPKTVRIPVQVVLSVAAASPPIPETSNAAAWEPKNPVAARPGCGTQPGAAAVRLGWNSIRTAGCRAESPWLSHRHSHALVPDI